MGEQGFQVQGENLEDVQAKALVNIVLIRMRSRHFGSFNLIAAPSY